VASISSANFIELGIFRMLRPRAGPSGSNFGSASRTETGDQLSQFRAPEWSDARGKAQMTAPIV